MRAYVLMHALASMILYELMWAYTWMHVCTWEVCTYGLYVCDFVDAFCLHACACCLHSAVVLLNTMIHCIGMEREDSSIIAGNNC